MDQKIANSSADVASKPKRPYQKPELVAQGTVGEATRSGGMKQAHDGVFTNALS